jgi:hypothetical protein
VYTGIKYLNLSLPNGNCNNNNATMENGGARILASFEPCVLTDGSMVLNLPDE